MEHIKKIPVICAQCQNIITGRSILAVKRDFCSDVCHLRFWKEEMTILGGQWITNEALGILSKLDGDEREAYYSKIVSFIMDNMNSTSFFSSKDSPC